MDTCLKEIGIVLVGYVTEEGLCYLKAVRCGMLCKDY